MRLLQRSIRLCKISAQVLRTRPQQFWHSARHLRRRRQELHPLTLSTSFVGFCRRVEPWPRKSWNGCATLPTLAHVVVIDVPESCVKLSRHGPQHCWPTSGHANSLVEPGSSIVFDYGAVSIAHWTARGQAHNRLGVSNLRAALVFTVLRLHTVPCLRLVTDRLRRYSTSVTPSFAAT